MIEAIAGFPDGVVAFSAKGQVTRKDYEEVLIPTVESAFKHHQNLRIYYELGPQFTGIEAGAAWEDFMVAMEHFGHWRRAAIVTDAEWLRQMVNALRFLMPGQIRVFATAQAEEAKRWILAGEQ
jgi:hypothetical protein